MRRRVESAGGSCPDTFDSYAHWETVLVSTVCGVACHRAPIPLLRYGQSFGLPRMDDAARSTIGGETMPKDSLLARVARLLGDRLAQSVNPKRSIKLKPTSYTPGYGRASSVGLAVFGTLRWRMEGT